MILRSLLRSSSYDLCRRLTTHGRRNFSICLSGAPGTGKSEFAHYLAEMSGFQPQVMRTSDLFLPFVGETEKNIAKAFRSAREEKTFLIFDEADSLLGNRRYAQRSWEISQVNEMLTWMESHPFPFACTTNLMDRLDTASLRRFTLKCCLDYLEIPQLQAAFQHFFNLSVEVMPLSRLTRLTSGDFAVVKQKAELICCDWDVETLIEMLSSEMQPKVK